MAGTYTGQELVSMVCDNIGRASDSETRSGQTIGVMALRWLNFAQWTICRKEDLLFAERTFSTEANLLRYNFPSDIRGIYSLRIEDGLSSKKLDCVMPSEMDKYVPKPDETLTGLPDFYIPFYRTKLFELYRIPDTAYLLRLRMSYWASAITLTTYSDYTYLDDILIGYATMYGFRYLQEWEDAAAWKKSTDIDAAEAIKAERELVPDWAPEYLGFTTSPPQSVGEYYNDPLIRSNP